MAEFVLPVDIWILSASQKIWKLQEIILVYYILIENLQESSLALLHWRGESQYLCLIKAIENLNKYYNVPYIYKCNTYFSFCNEQNLILSFLCILCLLSFVIFLFHLYSVIWIIWILTWFDLLY